MLERTIKAVLGHYGYKIARVDAAPSYTDLWQPQAYMGEEFMTIFGQWRKIMGVNSFSPSFYTTYRALKFLIANEVPGAFVESGVFKGSQCVLVALTLRHLGADDRSIYLYDTFFGMPEPGENDFELHKRYRATDRWHRERNGHGSHWNRGTLDEVRRNMLATGYDEARLVIVPGKVQDTLPKASLQKIAFLRLDTNFYDSTRAEMEWLYPCLSPGGVLIVDGYGRWSGQKKAVDEYFNAERAEPLMLRVGYNDWISVRACRLAGHSHRMASTSASAR